MKNRFAVVSNHVRHGFTIVETFIVVVILGILAATVLPQFTAASRDAKEAAVVQDLQLLRAQVNLYKFQHDGNLPGTLGEISFEEALLSRTDLDGRVNRKNGKFGPYIVGQLPPNPYNSLSTVKVIDGVLDESQVDGETGWLFSRSTGEVRANFRDALHTDETRTLFSL